MMKQCRILLTGKKYLIVLVMALLMSPFANAKITKEDKQIYKKYNGKIKILSNEVKQLRTIKDYKNKSKIDSIEKKFVNLDTLLKSMSDQNDVNVKKLRKGFDNFYNVFATNVKKAGGSKPTQKKVVTSSKPIKKSNGKKTVQDVFSEFNNNLKNAKTGVINHKKWADYTNPKNIQNMKKLFAKVELSLKEMKPFKNSNERSAKNAYASLKKTYDTNLTEAKKIVKRDKATSNSSSANKKEQLSSSDRKLLKKIRNIFIRNDYKFREIDVISLQNPKYDKELKVIIDKLEQMIAPIKDKTFDRSVRKTLKDFNTVKTTYNNAKGISTNLASKSGDIDSQLNMIQKLFNDKDFDPRIKTDNPAKIKEWAKQMRNYKNAIPKTLKFFEHAKATSIKARSDKFSSYSHWFKSYVEDRINYAITDKNNRWDVKIRDGLYPLTYKPKSLENTLKHQDDVKLILEKLAIAKKANRAKEIFEETYYKSISSKTKENKISILKLEEKTRTAQLNAIKNKKLPKPISTDQKLLKLVKKHIHSVGRKLGNIEKIIITSTPKIDNYIQWDGENWHHSKWEWFSYKVVEKEKDRYFIKEGSLRKNLKGWSMYQVEDNVWFLWHLSLEGDEILKENIK